MKREAAEPRALWQTVGGFAVLAAIVAVCWVVADHGARREAPAPARQCLDFQTGDGEQRIYGRACLDGDELELMSCYGDDCLSGHGPVRR